MSYIVFARKWRPQDFVEVIGQEHITTTLKNAIKQERVAHAYLFCGPRGIGKTTTARILAKALNCQKGPTPVPCNKCVSCKEITQGTSLDIIEIDGASNRGIDEIRNLKENIKFAPQHGKYKVYIIDEVHMLTQEAFNALLKTLEEPPAHVKFIFATTAAHKVIPTILSRCQRFNFRRLSSQDIIKKLKDIAKKEKIKIEDAALFTIVRAASGSMRDAESLLDQLATYCKNNITAKDTNKVLGTVEQDRLFEFAQYIISKDAASAISFVNKIMDEGVDSTQFIQALIEYFRNALIIKQGKELVSLVDMTKEDIQKTIKQTQGLTTEDILYTLYNLISTNYSMRSLSLPRVSMELLVVKLSQKESIVSLDEIMHKLSALEKTPNISESTENKPKHTDDIPDKRVSMPKQKQMETYDNNSNEEIEEDIDNSDVAASSETISPELYRIREVMGQVIKNIKQEKIYIASCLSEGKLISFNKNILTIGFAKKNTFHKESLEKSQNKKLIEDQIAKVLGQNIGVDFIILKEIISEEDNKDGNKKQGSHESKNPLKKALSDPIIKTALDMFDGSIMKFM
jgi:DNA polymerase-3 subunit gamma/tau